MFQKIKNMYHLLQAKIAIIYFGSPSKKMKVIGITGTDGKTTTTSLTYHILKSAGKKASMISTVYAKVGDREFDTGLHTTTPHSFEIQKLIKKSVDAGDEYFVLETTSHAIDQNRVYGIHYTVGLITNVTHEHLDYHKTYENYLRTKARLLEDAETALINKDDQSYQPLSRIMNRKNKKFKTFSLKQEADFTGDLSVKIHKSLPEFNKYNYLAAYSICTTLGIDEADILNALKTFTPPPGRNEVVYEKDITVIVDFAHTPNATYEVLKGVRDQYTFTSNKLIHLFGSAGHRDATKRPSMGEASGEFADMTILTEDDPRTENVTDICHQIAQGLQDKGFHEVISDEFGKKTKEYTVIPDRRTAIQKALSVAHKGDIVVLTGKGHEKSIARGDHEDVWSDKDVVLELLQNSKV